MDLGLGARIVYKNSRKIIYHNESNIDDNGIYSNCHWCFRSLGLYRRVKTILCFHPVSS